MIDITNLKQLKKTFIKFKPDFVFHLAAQAIVKSSYENPVRTWHSNLIGTVNVLECLRSVKKNNSCNYYQFKAYKNIETKKGYKEKDVLKGDDPYGASKSSADIGISSYYHSYFSKKIVKF